jgi:hypothetical protein
MSQPRKYLVLTLSGRPRSPFRHYFQRLYGQVHRRRAEDVERQQRQEFRKEWLRLR